MTKSIEWSPRAKNDYLNILNFLEEQWGEKIIKRFDDRLQHVLKLISESPEIYPASKKAEYVRKCVLSKQTSLYYRINLEKIEIITLFDNRQDSDKLKI